MTHSVTRSWLLSRLIFSGFKGEYLDVRTVKTFTPPNNTGVIGNTNLNNHEGPEIHMSLKSDLINS